MPKNPNKKKCTHPNCKAWAIRGQDHCSAHRPGGVPFAGAPAKNINALKHGMYTSTIALGELTPLALTDSLGDELIALRAHLARLDQMLLQATAADMPHLFSLFLSGLRTIAKMLRESKALSPDKAESVEEAIEDALHELQSMLEVKIVP